MWIHHTEFSKNVKFCRDLLQTRGNIKFKHFDFFKKINGWQVGSEFQTFIFLSVCSRTP